jgi:N-methylhydantoinase A
MGFYVGTDVGGTFTDVWVTDGLTRAQVFKSPTTADVMTGVIDGVRLAAEAYGHAFDSFCREIERFGHGTTVGLNALLTGRAAKTAVLTTQGFGDTLEIGRMRRQTAGVSDLELTDFYIRERHRPLTPRDLVIELVERVDANGRIVTPLDVEHARMALRDLAGRDVEAIAVCTLWSSVNPVHEIALRDLIREEMPTVFITLSHEIAPVVGEYGRMSTTAANAALGPIAGRYLRKLESTLREAGMQVPILMMTNAGGVLPTSVLDDRPAYALFSGPAAGVIGSLAIGERLGYRNILTSDIGGTSFDVGVIVDGKPAMRREISLAGADIRVPSIDVDSIGAGGGSIASVVFGNLVVGPQSAGANPGPVCYGRGGKEPTSTDADLVLGMLDPDHFIGGRMKLDVAAARAAIEEKIARPLNMSIEEAAWGIREVLDSRMADLLRRVTIERGHDPREFVLFANGGAGPSHAWAMARDLGLTKFVVPAAATAQSAFGCAVSALGLTREAPLYLRISPGSSPAVEGLASVDASLARLESDARNGLHAAGARGDVPVERTLAIRYRGQTNSLDIAVAEGPFGDESYRRLVSDFQRSYEVLFGRGSNFERAGYEILAARAIAKGDLSPPRAATGGDPVTEFGTRNVIFDIADGAVATRIYRTSFPPPGTHVIGPAIIEFPGQSVVIPPRAEAKADDEGNLHVELG